MSLWSLTHRSISWQGITLSNPEEKLKLSDTWFWKVLDTSRHLPEKKILLHQWPSYGYWNKMLDKVFNRWKRCCLELCLNICGRAGKISLIPTGLAASLPLLSKHMGTCKIMRKLILSWRAEGWRCQQQRAEEEEWQAQIKNLPVISFCFNWQGIILNTLNCQFNW